MISTSLDPSQTYLIPIDLDRGDLLALRHRLTAILEASPYRWMKTEEPIDKTVPGYEDVPLHKSSFQTRQLPGQPPAEDLHVIVGTEIDDEHPSVRIAIADRPGEKAVSLREPIRLDRSNAIPCNTEGEHIAPVIEAWLDLLDRPLFGPSPQIAETRRIVAQAASELLVHEASQIRENPSLRISITAGKPYRNPHLWFGLKTGTAIATKALTPEATKVFASLIPGLVEIRKSEDLSRVAYDLKPAKLFDRTPLSRCSTVIDSMKALRPFSHLDRCLSDEVHIWASKQ